MTRDEIVQMAWDCGILMRSHQHQDHPTKLERFAERIAAAEREACAEICRAYAMPDGTSITAMVLEKAILARSKL